MKRFVNGVLAKLIGYNLQKVHRDKVEELFLSEWFKSFSIKTVIDVGANRGQFATSVRKAMPDVQILAFEPIPAEFRVLQGQFKHDQNFEAFEVACSSKESIAKFKVNDFSPTSSLLSQTELQRDFYPRTGKEKEIKVKVMPLDHLLDQHSFESGLLLKIDVQGTELDVLKGARRILDQSDVVYVECSFEEFYEGQSLFDDIYRFLHTSGFKFKGVGDQLNAGVNQEPSQIDALFIKR